MSATCVDTSSNFFFDSLSFFRHCMTYSMTLGTLFSGRICHFEDIFCTSGRLFSCLLSLLLHDEISDGILCLL